MDLKEESVLGDAVSEHWYYRSKVAALAKYIGHLQPERVLDVGAGSGFFSKELLRNGGAKEALCVDLGYAESSQDTVAGRPIAFLPSCEQVSVDVVLLMDVLEHVDDDVGLLREYVDKVEKGTHFLVTVPAFSFLWSGHDVFLEHRRRYKLAQVEKVVRDAGLVVERSSYYYGLIFPLAATLRLADRMLKKDVEPQSQLKKHGVVANSILTAVCAIERPFMKLNRLAGLSVFCLAKKA